MPRSRGECLPSRDERRFEGARVAVHVEQRRTRAGVARAARSARPAARGRRPARRRSHRTRPPTRDQFRHPGRDQLARRRAAAKLSPCVREHGQPREQRVVHRRVRAERDTNRGTGRRGGTGRHSAESGRSARRRAACHRRRASSASVRRFPAARSSICRSHSTLAGCRRSSVIQRSNRAGEILYGAANMPRTRSHPPAARSEPCAAGDASTSRAGVRRQVAGLDVQGAFVVVLRTRSPGMQ